MNVISCEQIERLRLLALGAHVHIQFMSRPSAALYFHVTEQDGPNVLGFSFEFGRPTVQQNPRSIGPSLLYLNLPGEKTFMRIDPPAPDSSEGNLEAWNSKCDVLAKKFEKLFTVAMGYKATQYSPRSRRK